MKVSTSWFGKAGLLEKWQIPVSVSPQSPSWFSGCSLSCLFPGSQCPGSSDPLRCQEDPATCAWLASYREKLEKLDWTDVYAQLLEICRPEDRRLEERKKLEFVLLVAEPPDCPCSQRFAVQLLAGCRELSFKKQSRREERREENDG